MTDILERARALLAAATPGPWRVAGRSPDGTEARLEMGQPWTRSTWLLLSEGDSDLIAACPDLVRDLAAEVERLREALGDAATSLDTAANWEFNAAGPQTLDELKPWALNRAREARRALNPESSDE